MTNMESKHKAAVIIIAVLAAGGYFIGSDIIEASSKSNQAASNVALVEEVNKGHIQTIEKLLLLNGPRIDEIRGVINDGQIGLIKNVSDADYVEFNSFKVDKTAIQNIAKTQKVAKDKVEKELKLTIDGFKRATDYLLFTVTDTANGNSFSLKVDLGFTTQEELDLIFAAMKDATEINLSVDLVVKSGTVERGRLIKVVTTKP